MNYFIKYTYTKVLIIFIAFLFSLTCINAYEWEWDGSRLTITATDGTGEEITVCYCAGKAVTINGDWPKDSGGNYVFIPIIEIQELIVLGGPGPDQIDLRCVQFLEFYNLHSSEDYHIVVDAAGGDDIIYGSDIGCVFHGGDGNDLINCFSTDLVSSDNILYGNDGDDQLLGSDGKDYMEGGLGNDRLNGLKGEDVLKGEDGDDTLLGGDDNDELYGGLGNDELYGGGNNDKLYGDENNDLLRGDEGDDELYGGTGNDQLYGGSANDKLYGEDGIDLLHGDYGNDELWGGNQNDEIHGDFGDDKLWGEDGNDHLTGGDGNDTIWGDDEEEQKSGDDLIYGDIGNDIIYGGSGNDELHGGSDNDRIYGSTGDDKIYGEGGDDYLYGDEGDDTVDGGSGNDQIVGGVGKSGLYGSKIDDGKDEQMGGEGNDGIMFDQLDYLVDGGPGNDRLMIYALQTKKQNKIRNINDDGGQKNKIAILVNDLAGLDTLDFSEIDEGIIIDLDIQANSQIYNNSGDEITLNGLFENIIGTDFSDEITLDPLLEAPRFVDGGDNQKGEDILNFDGKGVICNDDGTCIIAEGYQPVAYTDIEVCNINNVAGLTQEDAYLPTEYSLHQNYPNPFNPTTSILFDLPESGYTLLLVFNQIGELVSELINTELKAGRYYYEFDATGLSSGIYYYRLSSKNYFKSKKMILLK